MTGASFPQASDGLDHRPGRSWLHPPRRDPAAVRPARRSGCLMIWSRIA
jgi:hypothetical protein